jgi:prolipoprotein diacylglyceryl transferase
VTGVASIPSPPSNGFHLGPLFVHAYGLAYIAAVLVAVAIVRRRWAARGGDPGLVQDVALVAFPAGIVGGRLYFLATSWNEVPHHWWGPLAVWQGGLGIWGGIAAGTVAGIWVLRRRGADIPAFLDAAAPALLVAQAIGRVGNYFNQELFGGPTTLPWGLEIDAAHRPAGYAAYSTFHPTFLYELVWNLALAGALVALGRRRQVRAPGLFALYVAGYSGFRIFEETLRVDPAHHLLGLRLNFYVASLLCVAGLTWFLRTQRVAPRTARRGATLLAVGWLLCAASGCGQMTRETAEQPPTRLATPSLAAVRTPLARGAAQSAWAWCPSGSASAGVCETSSADSAVVTGTDTSRAIAPTSVATIGSGDVAVRLAEHGRVLARATVEPRRMNGDRPDHSREQPAPGDA